MTRHLFFILAIVMCAGVATAEHQTDAVFPALVVNKDAIRSLQKAEKLYTQGNFKRAYFIYRNELAPIGDKYAQYMVGYMHLVGQGTAADRVAAAAWYRLAAERGTSEFVLVHDQLLVSLTPEQIAAYDRVFVDLRKRYGDLPLLMRAVRNDLELLGQGTGSRIGGSTAPVTIVNLRRGTIGSADDFYKGVEKRLNARLKMIAGYIQSETGDTDLNSISLEELEERVNQVLESSN